MNAKILLIGLSAAAFTSCSTAYKSAQTPDDVYYSPARVTDERQDNREETTREVYTADDCRTRMTIRDPRWRYLDDEYDYSYRYSPYSYSYNTCACTNYNYGYYYNPFYYPRPLYHPTVVTYKPALNTTPRMVNLNGYKNYNAAVAYNPKTGSSITSSSYSNNGNTRQGQVRQYNNSNESRVGKTVREIFTPSNNSSNSNSSGSSRTYTPSSSGSSGSSSGGSSSGSSSGSVSRPGRG